MPLPAKNLSRTLLRRAQVTRLDLCQAACFSNISRPVQEGQKQRTIGLLGGMSWQSTALYYSEINKRVRSRRGDIHTADLLIRSFNYADLVALFSANEWDKATVLFGDAGRALKAAGADGLVLCANLAHRVADGVEQQAGLPLLHIADFTGAAVAEQGYRRVGLLGTKAVMELDFYRDWLKSRYGLEVSIPGVEFRQAIDRIVFAELSKEIVTRETKDMFMRVCKDLVEKEGVEALVLACTELRMVLSEDSSPVPLFETTTLHARGVADWSLGDC